MDADLASDEVTDLIALIELHRQEKQKEAGLAAACSEALRKLNELLESEKATLQQLGPGNGNPANVEAVTRQIQRTRNLMSGGGKQHNGRHQQRPSQPRHGPRNGASRDQPRNKSRRPAGRRGDR